MRQVTSTLSAKCYSAVEYDELRRLLGYVLMLEPIYPACPHYVGTHIVRRIGCCAYLSDFVYLML